MRVAKLLLVVGLVLAVSGTAGAVAIPFTQAWGAPAPGAPVNMHAVNWAMGSVYTGFDLGGVPVPLGVYIPAPTLAKTPPTGGMPGEDGWGIFQIDQIFKGNLVGVNNIVRIDPANPLYDIATANGGVEIFGIYQGRVDLFVRFNDENGSGVLDAGDSQTIEFAGDAVDVYAQLLGTADAETTAFLGAAAVIGDAGSSGRLATGDYVGIGFDSAGAALPAGVATLALTLAGETGYMGREAVAAIPVEGRATFFPSGLSGSGEVDIFYSVTGGTEVLTWNGGDFAGLTDVGIFTPTKVVGAPYDGADFKIHVTDQAVAPVGDYDWLVTSSDPITAAVIIPEPITMIGALMGLGGVAGYIRRRRS